MGEHFSFINSTGNFARNRFHGKLIKLSVTKKNCIFMSERDCENKKLVFTKFSLFLQTPNSNFRYQTANTYADVNYINRALTQLEILAQNVVLVVAITMTANINFPNHKFWPLF